MGRARIEPVLDRLSAESLNQGGYRQVLAHFRPDQTSPASGPRATDRRLMARLVYDTSAQPLPSGVRAVIQRARRLLFAADDLEVVLQVSPEAAPERLKVMGQVLAEGLPVADAGVRLDGPAGPRAWTADREGEFRFAELPAGDYVLEVGTPERVLEMPTLTLTAA